MPTGSRQTSARLGVSSAMERDDEKASVGSKSKSGRKSKQPSSAMPWKVKLTYSFADFLADRVCRPDGTLNRRLLNLLHRRVPVSPRSSTVPTHDVVIDATRDLWFRVYLPKAAVTADAAAGDGTRSKLPLVVFFHGGGFALLSPDSYEFNDFCRRLARQIPAVLISVNYRRSPEHRCPAPYDDGCDVLRFLDEGANAGDSTTGVLPDAVETLFRVADLSRCFLAGDSAGGNIVHHVARRWTANGSQVPKRVRLDGLVLLQPFFGGESRVDSEIRLNKVPLINTVRTDWMWRLFLPEGADRDHEAANVFGPKAGSAAELGEKFPPAVVVVGGFDPLQDWQRRYAEGLKQREKEVRLIEYPRGFHGFYIYPKLKDTRMLMDRIKCFINDTK